MSLPRRTVGVVLLAVVVAPPALAQLPVRRSASLDVAAAVDHRLAVRVEPLVSRRVTLQIDIEHYDVQPQQYVQSRALYGTGPTGTLDVGSELQVNAGGRVYLPVGSASAPHEFGMYLGALLGWHQRTGPFGNQRLCLGCAVGRSVDSGFEPTVEFGTRMVPLAPLILDLGLRTRLVTFGDPANQLSSGQLDPRVTLSLGATW